MPIRQTGSGIKQKSITDIVFVIDSSGSMGDCFEGVKDYIQEFTDGLNFNPNNPVDFRLAVVAANIDEYQIKDFTTDISDFRSSVSRMKCGGYDEFTLPALDYAMDLPFRHGVHKVVILFTDEPISGGGEVSLQRSGLDSLIRKAVEIRLKFFMFAPSCGDIERIANEVPGSFFTNIDSHSGFYSADFSSVLKQIGKTVSQSCAANVHGQAVASSVKKDIYGLGSMDYPTIRRV